MNSGSQKNQNQLNQFLKDYFNIIILFLVIIILTVSYFLFIKPKYNETMLAIQSNISQQQKLYNEQKKKLESLKTISGLYNKISPSDLKKFNNVLPNDYVKESLFGELEEIISQSGLVIDSISINKEGDDVKKDAKQENKDSVASGVPDKVSEINMEIALSAVNYSSFKNFLKVLENNLRLFDVKGLSFLPDSNSANLSLTTYYYKP